MPLNSVYFPLQISCAQRMKADIVASTAECKMQIPIIDGLCAETVNGFLLKFHQENEFTRSDRVSGEASDCRGI